jgi:hypothetical protein
VTARYSLDESAAYRIHFSGLEYQTTSAITGQPVEWVVPAW